MFYSDKITSALSGGFDSRLMLVLKLKEFINPKLYVYGSNTNSDVIIAKLIAINENLNLDHTNKFEIFDESSITNTIYNNFWDLDASGSIFNKLFIY